MDDGVRGWSSLLRAAYDSDVWMHLLAKERCGSCEHHTHAEDKKSSEHDQSVFHSISLFFDKLEAYGCYDVGDSVDGKEKAYLHDC